MGVVEKYYGKVPEKYLVSTNNHIDQIASGLTEYFGKDWGDFKKDYVEETKDDRLIVQDENGNVVFHMRIFDKDHDGYKCDGVGGVFRKKEADGKCVKELFDYIYNNYLEDVDFGFGFCKKTLAEHYVNNVIGGGYVDYDDNFVIYYLPTKGFEMTEKIKEGLKKFELF